MTNVEDSLNMAMQIEGAIGVALVDWTSGMALGQAGGSNQINLEMAAAGNTQVVRAKMSVLKSMNLNTMIEDILVTLTSHYHIVRPVQRYDRLFLYLALHREQANLALARYKLATVERHLEV